MLIEPDLPHCFWPEAAENYVRIYNQLPHSALTNILHEMLLKVDIQLIIGGFGSKAYVHIQSQKISSLMPIAISGILPNVTKRGNCVEAKSGFCRVMKNKEANSTLLQK